MRYGLLENGDEIEAGDEYFWGHSGVWKPMTQDLVGLKYDSICSPMRRLLNKPKPVEEFVVPFGIWSGCTGEVFMDGTSKKIRLHNVFYGAKPLVIDFPRRERYDNKHIVLEYGDIIQDGDLFTSGSGSMACQATVGMTVEKAYRRFNSIVHFLRPVA